jgi:hypothetical protein
VPLEENVSVFAKGVAATHVSTRLATHVLIISMIVGDFGPTCQGTTPRNAAKAHRHPPTWVYEV